MAKKNSYQQANEDIAALIAEVKVRRGWKDKDIAKILELTADTVKFYRVRKLFPVMKFSKVVLLAAEAGYDVKFVKREMCR